MTRTSWTHPVHLVLGLLVWSLWFVVVYTGLSLGCQRAPTVGEQGPFNVVTVVTLAGGVLVGLGLLWAARGCWRVARCKGDQDTANEQQRAVASVAAGLYLVSAFAALAIVLPGLFMMPCL